MMSESQGTPKRVLVVDDDPGVQAMIQAALELDGHQVLIAASGEAMLDLLSRELVHLIILDVLLPDRSGIDLCKEIKRLPLLKYIPVIFVTVRGKTMDKIEGLRVGGDDYLAKPFNVEELLSRVRTILSRSGYGINSVTVLPNQYAAEREFDSLTIGQEGAITAVGIVIERLEEYRREFGEKSLDVERGMAQLLLSLISLRDEGTPFLAQVAPDQFLLFCRSGREEELLRKIGEGYQKIRPGFFRKGLKELWKKAPTGLLELKGQVLAPDVKQAVSFRTLLQRLHALAAPLPR